MRLLNTENLKFEEFDGDRTPKYAILSHRWEGNEEVTFEEMEMGSPAAREKRGFSKICGFCDVAKSNGYRYAWIDTCCIKQSDSTELSEAVNSMFSWYGKSSICITYLSDFSSQQRNEPFESALEKSQWFRRSWTLQELIAPARVEFYDRKWRRFGTKQELAGLISKITRINISLLRGQRPLRNFGCAQKISWAANRYATRPEDRAYSLLGLFDVGMPLIYNGDGPSAFYRLQEEIIKHSKDQSIFAWVQPSSGEKRMVSPKESLVQNCSVLAPSPDCFRFSSAIVPYRHDESDISYSLTNTGLEITERIRQVVSIDDAILLELALSCYDEHTHHQVSIALVATKSNFKNFQKLLSNDFELRPGRVLEIQKGLLVWRVEPHYLGPVRLSSGCISTYSNKEFGSVPMRISPVFDSNQAKSWMKNPQWEADTRGEMKLAKTRIRKLYDINAKEKRDRLKNYALFGGLALAGGISIWLGARS